MIKSRVNIKKKYNICKEFSINIIYLANQVKYIFYMKNGPVSSKDKINIRAKGTVCNLIELSFILRFQHTLFNNLARLLYINYLYFNIDFKFFNVTIIEFLLSQ